MVTVINIFILVLSFSEKISVQNVQVTVSVDWKSILVNTLQGSVYDFLCCFLRRKVKLPTTVENC